MRMDTKLKNKTPSGINPSRINPLSPNKRPISELLSKKKREDSVLYLIGIIVILIAGGIGWWLIIQIIILGINPLHS
jgi:hypothetical protein